MDLKYLLLLLQSRNKKKKKCWAKSSTGGTFFLIQWCNYEWQRKHTLKSIKQEIVCSVVKQTTALAYLIKGQLA